MRAIAAAFTFALCHLGVDGNSLHVAEKCKGGMCPDPKFPILDFDKDKDTCICRAHPCWNNDGVEHKCNGLDFPFLRFSYNSSGSLKCGCGKTAVMDSVHVARDLCAGESCPDPAYPILDWDPEGSKCICRVHPCTVDASGTRHRCLDPRFPLLHVVVEPGASGGAGPQKCDCHSKLERPASQLRGSRSRDGPLEQACTWSQRGPYASSAW